jgi:uncharacterized protein (TIGR00730 family)
VYCASSEDAAAEYRSAASELGRLLAEDGRTIVYGGSRSGSMGALASGALAAGGRVIGILPGFLRDLEISHGGLTELHIVEDMRTRKHLMLSRSDAVVALPGGCGTFEELLEAITLKRLGVYAGPIVLVNTRNYFDALLRVFEAAVSEGFMQPRHLGLWRVVARPADVVPALRVAATGPGATA